MLSASSVRVADYTLVDIGATCTHWPLEVHMAQRLWRSHSQMLVVAGLRRDRLASQPFWRQLSVYGSCHCMLTISCVPASLSSSGESSGVRANQRPQ